METMTGRYELLDDVRRGPYTRVVKAFDTEARGLVLLKVLRKTHEADPTLRTSLAREAAALARVRHGNVAPVLDIVTEPHPSYAVPVLDGRPLSDCRRRGPAPASVLGVVGGGIARGLAALHAIGLVHGDVRPETVVVTRGIPVIFDPGLVKDLALLDKSTRTGVVVAAADYAAPELIRGQTADHRCDLYALGLVLFELATGRHPFRCSDPIVTLRRHLFEPVPALGDLRPDLPAAFAELVGSLIAKRPSERPRDAATVARAIARALESTDALVASDV
jgi:serine/threonine-protein kinase